MFAYFGMHDPILCDYNNVNRTHAYFVFTLYHFI